MVGEGDTGGFGSVGGGAAEQAGPDRRAAKAPVVAGVSDVPDAALDSLVGLAAQLCEAPIGLITLVDGARQLFEARVGMDGPATAPLAVGFCPVVVERGEPLVIPDTLADPAYAQNPAARENGIRFYAGVPLRSGGGHAFGTLCVLDKVPRPAGLTAAQLDVLQALAGQVVSQFELRRLLAEQRATLCERDALARVQAVIAAAGGELDAILAALVAHALEAVPAAEGAVLELLDGEMLEYRAVSGVLLPHRGLLVPLHGSLAGSCAETNAPILVDDVWVDGRAVRALIGPLQLRAAVLAPVARGGQVLGVLKLQSSKPAAFTERDLQVVRLFAGTATAGLTEVRAAEAQRAVLAGSRRQQAILDSAVDFAIIAIDTDGVVTDWNVGAERILGWTAASMLGQSAACIFTPDDQATGQMQREMRDAVAEGRASDERWHQRHDGGRFWASGEMMPLRDEHGLHQGFVKIIRDRTAEHRAGEALREAEGALRRAQEAGGVGVFSVDVANNLLEATAEFCRLYGVAVRERLPPEEIEALVVPQYRNVVSNAARRGSGDVPPWVEYQVRRADNGQTRWLSRRAEVERDVAGRPVRFVGVVHDITEQKIAQDSLAQSEARYRALFEAIDDGFCIIEFFDGPHGPLSDYVHVEANPAAERHTGFTHMTGKTLRELAPAEADGWAELYGEVLRTGQPIRFERELLATGRTVEVAVARIEPASRRQVSVLFRDVTLRKQAEAALQASNDTLEERVAERTAELMHAEAALRQAQKMEAVGQLTGGLAHDFNNLLAGISGSLELLGTRVTQGRFTDLSRYIGAAQGAAGRAAALTHRLLAFSRRQTLDPKPTDVNRLVSGMEELIRRTVGPAVAVAVDGAADIGLTLVDPPQLESALLNLCINARDAMPDGGRLTIETANRWLDERSGRERDMQPGQYVALCVSDTGTGMAPDVIAKAFDPFFTTKPLGQGTGLGLSMIYGFVRQSGGQARIHSVLDRGTTVCLYLPRFLGAAAEAGAVPELADAPRAGRGETVLVVDDEPTLRMLVAEVLEELGYAAIEAADGASGLRVLQSDARVDLLVTDVGLPGGMNGRQMADAARVRRPDLKVLFITGYAENAAIGDGHLDPGMHIMTKPFAMETLASRIKDLIATRPSPTPAARSGEGRAASPR